MRFIFLLMIFNISLCGRVSRGESAIRVVTTLPDLASIAGYVGGNLVQVEALSQGYQDPHYVTPKPSLMASVNRADLFLEIGLNLEIWTERVLDGARNGKVRIGRPGHVYTSVGVPLRQRPTIISRSEGDLHPQGNPHIWLDPLNGKLIAANIVAGLGRIAPRKKEKEFFNARGKDFDRLIDEKLFGRELVRLLGGSILTRLARKGELITFLEQKEFGGEKLINKLGGWLGESQVFHGEKILTYHLTWVYFAERFGLEVANTIEEKPGIPPSARRKERLIQQVRMEKIRVIFVSTFYDQAIPQAIAEATGARMVILPIMTGGVKEATDYFALFDYLIGNLREAFRSEETPE